MNKLSVGLSAVSEWTVVPLWKKGVSPGLSLVSQWTIAPLWNKVISPAIGSAVKSTGQKAKNEAKNQLKHVADEGLKWAQSEQAKNLLSNAKSLLDTHVIKPLKKEADPRISQLLETLKSFQEQIELLKDVGEDEEEKLVFFVDDEDMVSLNEDKVKPQEKLNELIQDGNNNLPENGILRELHALIEAERLDLKAIHEKLPEAIQFLEEEKSHQTGLIARFTVPEVLGLLGLSSSKQRSSSFSAKAEKAERAVLARMNNESIEIDPPKDLENDVEKKLGEITDLALKIGLIRLIFNGEWKKHFSGIYKEAESNTNENVDFDTAFLKAVEDRFSTAEKDQFLTNRVRYWVHLNITLPVIKFYAYGFMKQFKADLLAFLKRSPEERINDAFTLALMPFKAHMSAFYTFNESLAGKPLQGTVDDANRVYFDNLKSDKGETIDSTLLQFTHMIIERYAPKISWTKGIESSLGRFETKFSFPIIKTAITAGKVSIVWTSYFLTGVPEWMLNKVVKYAIKRQLKSVIKLNLFKVDSSEQKTHSRYQYFINRFITEKLRQFNAGEKKEESTPLKLRSSPTTQRQMQEIITELFQNIPLSIASSTAPALNTYFSGQPVEQGKQALYNLFVGQFAPTVSLEILKGLEHFLYDDKAKGKRLGLLSEFVWFTVSNLENTLTKESDAAEQAEMNATEAAMHEQLRMAVATLVKEGVKTALDPSKKYENETNAMTQDVKRQSEAFAQLMDGEVVEKFTTFHEDWKKLNEAILKMTQQFKETKIKKIVDYGSRLIESFNKATELLDAIIKDLEKSQKEKKTLEEQLEVFKGIQKQILEGNSRTKLHKLGILKGKKWVSEELKTKITRYEEYLLDFLKTPHTDEVLRLGQSKAQEFQVKLEEEKDKIQAKIDEETRKMNQRVAELQAERQPITEWNKRLKLMPVNSKDVSNPLAKLFETLPIEGKVHDVAVAAVMQCVSELLNFKEKPYHWNQVLIRALRASGTLLKR